MHAFYMYIMCVIILLQIAEMIRHVIDRHELAIPAILEIPSKDHPYDPNKDSILRRAKVRERGRGFVRIGSEPDEAIPYEPKSIVLAYSGASSHS